MSHCLAAWRRVWAGNDVWYHLRRRHCSVWTARDNNRHDTRCVFSYSDFLSILFLMIGRVILLAWLISVIIGTVFNFLFLVLGYWVQIVFFHALGQFAHLFLSLRMLTHAKMDHHIQNYSQSMPNEIFIFIPVDRYFIGWVELINKRNLFLFFSSFINIDAFQA